jgi:hypothetical protein
VQPDVPAAAEVLAAVAVAGGDDHAEAGALGGGAGHVDAAGVHVVGDVLDALAEEEELDPLDRPAPVGVCGRGGRDRLIVHFGVPYWITTRSRADFSIRSQS